MNRVIRCLGETTSCMVWIKPILPFSIKFDILKIEDIIFIFPRTMHECYKTCYKALNYDYD